MYDVTSRESFDNVRNWVNQISLNADAHINIYFVGNKCDMTDARVVTFEEGERLAAEFKCPFQEVSAMSGQKVNETFLDLAVKVKERLDKGGDGEGRTRAGSLLGSTSSLATLKLTGDGAEGAKPRRKCC